MRLEDDVQWGDEQRVYAELVHDQDGDLMEAMMLGQESVSVQPIMTNGNHALKAPRPIMSIRAHGLDEHEHEEGEGGESTAVQNKNAEQRAAHACAWLTSMYEPQENISMPRSALYDHYLEACSVSQHEPVNSATFGKLLRAVFPLLRTRRLGTRGNSKYHYYGIGIKSDQLDRVPPQYSTQLRTTPPGASRHGSVLTKKRIRIVSEDGVHNSPLLSRRSASSKSREPTTATSGFHDLTEFGRYLEQLCAPNPAALPLHIPYEHVQGFASAYHGLLMQKASMMAQQNFSQVRGHVL